MASAVYTQAKFELARGSLGWVDPTNVFRCMLVTSTYVYSSAHRFVADILASEVSDPSYGRQDVTGRTAQLDLGGDRGIMDAEDTLFPSLGGVIVGGATLYKRFGTDDLTPDSDPLVCFVDVPLTFANGGDFLVEYDVEGIIALKVC